MATYTIGSDMMKKMSPAQMPQISQSKQTFDHHPTYSQENMCKIGKALMKSAKMSCDGGGSMG